MATEYQKNGVHTHAHSVVDIPPVLCTTPTYWYFNRYNNCIVQPFVPFLPQLPKCIRPAICTISPPPHCPNANGVHTLMHSLTCQCNLLLSWRPKLCPLFGGIHSQIDYHTIQNLPKCYAALCVLSLSKLCDTHIYWNGPITSALTLVNLNFRPLLMT